MINITTAIYGKLAGSTLTGLIGGRLYEDEAQALRVPGKPIGQKLIYPYVVYKVLTSPFEKTFTEKYRNTLVQFSIFSTNPDSSEIKAIYNALSALYDECSMTITANTLIWMREMNLITMVEEQESNPAGTRSVKHYAVDFDVYTSLN